MTGSVGAGLRPRNTMRVIAIPVAIVVATLGLVAAALAAAQSDHRVEAAVTNAAIGTVILGLVLNASTSGVLQRILRTLAAGCLAAAVVTAAIAAGNGFDRLLAGLAAALALTAARQWFSDATHPDVRATLGILRAAAVGVGATLAALAVVTGDPWSNIVTAVVCAADIAVVALFAASRAGTPTAEFSLRAAAGLAAVIGLAVATVELLAQPGAAAWRTTGSIVAAGAAASVVVAMAATWRDSTWLHRGAAVVVLLALDMAAIAALATMPSSAVLPFAIALLSANLAAASNLWARWTTAGTSVAGRLRLFSVALTIVAGDAAVIWVTKYLPDMGASAAMKLLWLGTGGALLMVTARWMPSRLGYFIRRIVLGGVTILIVTFVVFYLTTLLPEAWWHHIVYTRNSTPESIARLMHQLGVDQPITVQYMAWLNTILQWPPDLGFSQNLHQPVSDALIGPAGAPWFETRVGATVVLLGASYVLQLLIAIPIGIISAVKQYSMVDNIVTTTSFVGISMPNYWLGSILIYFLAVLPYQNGHGQIFPAGGEFTDPANPTLGGLLWHLVLPAFVLAVQGIAGYARFVRGAMLDVLNQDFIRTARAKGLSPLRVTVRHAFRNSLLPLITLLGIDLPQIFVGAIITEFVFNWPGMGQLSVQEVVQSDVVMVIAIILILSVLVVLGSVIADLFYTVADPRIKYDEA